MTGYMEMIEECDECGGRERSGFLKDGLCRECRDIGCTPCKASTYVSPDEAERNQEYLDHVEQANRHRTLANSRRIDE